jgi:hypothetical protein
MLDIEQTFVQPDVDVNEIIEAQGLIRTLNNYDFECGVERLNNNPELQAVCILWFRDHESYWIMRGKNGYVYRVIANNNTVIYQNVL